MTKKSSAVGKKGTKKPSVRKLVKKLDEVFSIYTRKKYADDFGMVRCFTCGVTKHWKEMQNSHYVSRRHMSLRFEEKNTHPACLACNIFKHGALDEYAIRLQAKYGTHILHELNALKHCEKRFTLQELQELIEKYGSHRKDHL